MMVRGTFAALVFAVALPCAVHAQNFEVITSGNGDENGSNYYLLSVRGGLDFDKSAVPEGTVRNA